MKEVNLERILIIPDQSISYMKALDPLEAEGYSEIKADGNYENWKYFYTKHHKIYAVDDWKNFNTQVYEITLVEFNDFEEVKEADDNLEMNKFLEECNNEEMTLENLQDLGQKYFGGNDMESYDKDTYYSMDDKSYTFGFNSYIVDYDFIKRDKENIMNTTVLVTDVSLA